MLSRFAEGSKNCELTLFFPRFNSCKANMSRQVSLVNGHNRV
jgi:hypothetical protein